jgi:hypothetical protein
MTLRIPTRLRNWMVNRLVGPRLGGTPDFIVGEPDYVYLRRWYLVPRNRFLNVYLHEFLRSDDDRALHDHPWASVSLSLIGRYYDVTEAGRRLVLPGEVVYRRAKHTHRVELVKNEFAIQPYERPAWTLFITGPKVREWGFKCPQGWRHWREYVRIIPGGNARGRGCDE